MYNILLVEDSQTCQHIVEASLANLQTQLYVAANLAQARQRLSQQPKIDLVLLDLGLPDGDGLTLLKELQGEKGMAKVPVFLLTGEGSSSKKVSAFELGAEDYLVKPVDPMELRARIARRLRDLANTTKSETVVERGELTVELPLMKASVVRSGARTQLDLTSKEFKILALLIKQEGKIFSREEIVKNVWGESVHVLNRTVDSHICGLRKKMGTASHYIDCVPGEGYRFFYATASRAAS